MRSGRQDKKVSQSFALFFIMILLVQPAVLADSHDAEDEEEPEEEITPETFRELSDPGPDDLANCPGCTTTEFDLLDTSERASFLQSQYREEFADHFFSDPAHIGVNEQVERAYFSRAGNIEQSLDSAQRFLQIRYDGRYSIQTEPVPTGMSYDPSDDSFRSGMATLSLTSLAQPARIIRIIAVQGGFRFVTRDEDEEEGEEESVDFMSETDSTITFDEESGHFRSVGSDGEEQARFTTGEHDARITINDEGLMTVRGDARGFYRADGELIEFQNRQGALRVWADGRIRADDAEINTRSMYIDGRFHREGNNVVSYSFNRAGESGMVHTVVVDKATAMGSVSQGQVRRSGCEGIPTIDQPGGCGGVVTHLQQRFEGSAYGGREASAAGSDDGESTPQPPISAQEARDRARQLRMQRPDIGENGEVWIAGTRGGEVSVYARGRVGVQSFTISGGNVQHMDLGRPRYTGHNGRSVLDYSAAAETDRFQVLGQGRYDDRQIHLDAERDGTFVQRLMNRGRNAETYEVDCDDCEDGQRAAVLTKRMMIVRERDIRVRGTGAREQITIGERYDEATFTEQIQWEGGLRLEYVQRGDSLRTTIPTANLQQIASYTQEEGATLAFDRDFFVRTGSGDEWFGISTDGIGSYESTAADDEFTPRSVTTNLRIRSTIGDIVVPTSDEEMEGVRRFLSALGSREWAGEGGYPRGYAQLRNVGGITDERVIAALSQETGINLEYLQRDDEVGEEYTDRIVSALRLAAAGRTRTTLAQQPQSIEDLQGNAQHYLRQQQTAQGQIYLLQAQRLIAEQEGQDTTAIDRSMRQLRRQASQLSEARERTEQQVQQVQVAQQRAADQRRDATAYGDDLSADDQRRLQEADQIRQQQESARARIAGIQGHIRTLTRHYLQGEGSPGLMARLFDFNDPDAGLLSTQQDFIDAHAPDARRQIAQLNREMAQLAEQIRLSDQRLASLGHESESQVLRVRILMAGGRHDLAQQAMDEPTLAIDPATGRIAAGPPIIDDAQTRMSLQMMARIDQGDTRGIRYDPDSGRVYTSQRVAILTTPDGGTEEVPATRIEDLSEEQRGRIQTWGEHISEQYIEDPAMVNVISSALRSETERHLAEDYNRAFRTESTVREQVGDAQGERTGFFYNWGHALPCIAGMCWAEVFEDNEGAASRAATDRRVGAAMMLTIFRHGRCGEGGSRQCTVDDIRGMDANEARRQLRDITLRTQGQDPGGAAQFINSQAAQDTFDERLGHRFISGRGSAGFQMAANAESGQFTADQRVRELQAQALLDEADRITAIHHDPEVQRHVYEQILQQYGDTPAADFARDHIRQIALNRRIEFAGVGPTLDFGVDSRIVGVFATEMIGDPTNFIPVGLVARGAARATQLTVSAIQATEFAVQASRAAQVGVELNQARRALQVAERTAQAARTTERVAEVERAAVRVAQLERQTAQFTTAQRVGATAIQTTLATGEAARAVIRPVSDAYEWLGQTNRQSSVLVGSAQRRALTSAARDAYSADRAAVQAERAATAAEEAAQAARRAPAIGAGPYRSAVTGAAEATRRAQELREVATLARQTADANQETLELQQRIVAAERLARQYQGVTGTVRRARDWMFSSRQAQIARREFMDAADAFNQFRRAPGVDLAGLADDLVRTERAYQQARAAQTARDPLVRATNWAFEEQHLGAPEAFIVRHIQRLERRRGVRNILFDAVDDAGMTIDEMRPILNRLEAQLDSLEEMTSGLPTRLDIRVAPDGAVTYDEAAFRALQASDPELASGVHGVIDELNDIMQSSGLADEAAVATARADAPATAQSVAAAVSDDIADAIRELPPEANPRISCTGTAAGQRCRIEIDQAGLAPKGTAERRAQDLALAQATEGLLELEQAGGDAFVQSLRDGIAAANREEQIIEEAAAASTTATAGEDVMDALRAREVGSEHAAGQVLSDQIIPAGDPHLPSQLVWGDDTGALARRLQNDIETSLANGDADRLHALRRALDDEKLAAHFRATGMEDELNHLRVVADDAIEGRRPISTMMGEEVGDISVTARRSTEPSTPVTRNVVPDEEVVRIRARVADEVPPGTPPEQIDFEVDAIVRRLEHESAPTEAALAERQAARRELRVREPAPVAPPTPELVPEEIISGVPPEAVPDALASTRRSLEEVQEELAATDARLAELEETIADPDTPIAERIAAQRERAELAARRPLQRSAVTEYEEAVRQLERGEPLPERPPVEIPPAEAPPVRPPEEALPLRTPEEARTDINRAQSRVAEAEREAQAARAEHDEAVRELAAIEEATPEEIRALELRARTARQRLDAAERELAGAQQDLTRAIREAPPEVAEEIVSPRPRVAPEEVALEEVPLTRASQRADELGEIAGEAQEELLRLDDELNHAVRQEMEAQQRLQARAARAEAISPDDPDVQALARAIEERDRLEEARVLAQDHLARVQEARVAAEQQDVVAITRRLIAEDPNIPRRMHEDYQEFLRTLSQEDRARARRTVCRIASPITCDDDDVGDGLERVFRPAEDVGVPAKFTPEEMDSVARHADDLPDHVEPSETAEDIAYAATEVAIAVRREQNRMLDFSLDQAVLRLEGQTLPQVSIPEGGLSVSSLPEGRFRPVELSALKRSAQNINGVDEGLLRWMEENGYTHVIGRQGATGKTYASGQALTSLAETESHQLHLNQLLFLRREDGTEVVWRLDTSHPDIYDAHAAEGLSIQDAGTRQMVSRTYEMVGERLMETTGVRRRALAGRRVELPGGHTVIETPAVDFVDLGKSRRNLEQSLDDVIGQFGVSDDAAQELRSALRAGERRFAEERMDSLLSSLERPSQRIIDEHGLADEEAQAVRRIDDVLEEGLLRRDVIDNLPPHLREDPAFVRRMEQAMSDQAVANTVRQELLASDTQLNLERFARERGLSRADVARVEHALREDEAVVAALGMSDSGVGIRIADDGAIEIVRFDEEFFGSGIHLPFRGREGLAPYARPYELRASNGIQNPRAVFSGANNYIFGYTRSDEVGDVARRIAQERGLEEIVNEEEALRLYHDEFHRRVIDAIDDVFDGPRREETLGLIRSAVHPQSGVDADAYARAFRNGVLDNVEPRALEDTIRQMVRNDGRLVVSPEVVSPGPDGLLLRRTYHTEEEVLEFYAKSPEERLAEMQRLIERPAPEQVVPRPPTERPTAAPPRRTVPKEAPARVELPSQQRETIERARGTTHEEVSPPGYIDDLLDSFDRISLSTRSAEEYYADLARVVEERLNQGPLLVKPEDVRGISDFGDELIPLRRADNEQMVAYARIYRRATERGVDNTLGGLREIDALLRVQNAQKRGVVPGGIVPELRLVGRVPHHGDVSAHLLVVQDAAPGENYADTLRRMLDAAGEERAAMEETSRQGARSAGRALARYHRSTRGRSALPQLQDDAAQLLESVRERADVDPEMVLLIEQYQRDYLRNAPGGVAAHGDFRTPNIVFDAASGEVRIIDFERSGRTIRRDGVGFGHPAEDVGLFMEDMRRVVRTALRRQGVPAQELGQQADALLEPLYEEFLAGYIGEAPELAAGLDGALPFYRAQPRGPVMAVDDFLDHRRALLRPESVEENERIVGQARSRTERATGAYAPRYDPAETIHDEMRNAGRLDDASIDRLLDELDDIAPHIREETIITCPGCGVKYDGDDPAGVQIASQLQQAIHEVESADPQALRMSSDGTADDLARALEIEEAAREQGVAVQRVTRVGDEARDAAQQPSRIGENVLAEARVERDSIIEMGLPISAENMPDEFAQEYSAYLRARHPNAPVARVNRGVGGVIDVETGTNAVVFRGRIPGVEEDVALKMSRDSRTGGMLERADDAIQAAEQELEAGLRLERWTIRHKDVEYPMGPRMYGLADCGGNPCLAMEEIRGVAVKPLYQQRRWDEVADVLTDDVIDQAVEGVRQAWGPHKLPSGNMVNYASDDWQFMVTPEGRVVFIDPERIVVYTPQQRALVTPEQYEQTLRRMQRRAREAVREAREAAPPAAPAEEVIVRREVVPAPEEELIEVTVVPPPESWEAGIEAALERLNRRALETRAGPAPIESLEVRTVPSGTEDGVRVNIRVVASDGAVITTNFRHLPEISDDTVIFASIRSEPKTGAGLQVTLALQEMLREQGIRHIVGAAAEDGLVLWPRLGARWMTGAEINEHLALLIGQENVARLRALEQQGVDLLAQMTYWDEAWIPGAPTRQGSAQRLFVEWAEANPQGLETWRARINRVRARRGEPALSSDPEEIIVTLGNVHGRAAHQQYPTEFLRSLGKTPTGQPRNVPYFYDIPEPGASVVRQIEATSAPTQVGRAERRAQRASELEQNIADLESRIDEVQDPISQEALRQERIAAQAELNAIEHADEVHAFARVSPEARDDARALLQEAEEAGATGVCRTLSPWRCDITLPDGTLDTATEQQLEEILAGSQTPGEFTIEEGLTTLERLEDFSEAELRARIPEVMAPGPTARQAVTEQSTLVHVADDEAQAWNIRMTGGVDAEEARAVERALVARHEEFVIGEAAPLRPAEEHAQPVIDPADIAPRDVRRAQNPLEERMKYLGEAPQPSYRQPSVGQAIERVLQSRDITTSDVVAVINHPQDYVLSFRHGTSSAALEGIAGEGRLMSYGDLRASGRVPFGGELSFGIRPGDISWDYISGVSFAQGGIDIEIYAREMTSGWTPQIGKRELEAAAQRLQIALRARDEGVNRIGHMSMEDYIAVSREHIAIAQQRVDAWPRLDPFEQQMISDPFPVVISAEVQDLSTPAMVSFQRGGPAAQGISAERLARGSISLDETPFVVFVPRERVPEVQRYLEARMGRPVRVQSIESLEAFDSITATFSPEGEISSTVSNRYAFREDPKWLAQFREDGAAYLRGEPPRHIRERMAAEAAEARRAAIAREEELAGLTPQGVQDELLSAHDRILSAQQQLGRAQEEAQTAGDTLQRWLEAPEAGLEVPKLFPASGLRREEMPAALRNFWNTKDRVDTAQRELHTAQEALGRAREHAAHVGLDADMELALVDTRRQRRIADLENRLRRARQERDMLREAARKAPAEVGDVRKRLPPGVELSPELRAFQEAAGSVTSLEHQLRTEQDLLQVSQAQKAGLQAQRAARAPDPQEAQGLLARIRRSLRGFCRIGSYKCDVELLPDADLDDVERALGKDVTMDNLDSVVASELGEALGPTPPTGSLDEISEALETASEISSAGPPPTAEPGSAARITARLEKESPGTSELAGAMEAEAAQIREEIGERLAARHEEIIPLGEEELIDITHIPSEFTQEYDSYLRTAHPDAQSAEITGVIDAETGANSIVLRGRLPGIDEDVALKMPRDVRTDGTPVYDTAEEAIRAAEQELAAGKRLQGWTVEHEGVEYPMGPRMHSLVDCGGNPCLAMEEIRGVAIKPLYQQERWDEVARVLTDDVIDQAYQGVRRAWQEGYASDDWQFIVTPEGRVVFIDPERIVPRTGRITLKSPEEYRDFLRSVQTRAREALEERRIAGLPEAERLAWQQRLADIEFTSQETVFRLNQLESAREAGRGVEEAEDAAREVLERLRGLSRDEGLEISPRLTRDEEDLVRTWADRLLEERGVEEAAPVSEEFIEVTEIRGPLPQAEFTTAQEQAVREALERDRWSDTDFIGMDLAIERFEKIDVVLPTPGEFAPERVYGDSLALSLEERLGYEPGSLRLEHQPAQDPLYRVIDTDTGEPVAYARIFRRSGGRGGGDNTLGGLHELAALQDFSGTGRVPEVHLVANVDHYAMPGAPHLLVVEDAMPGDMLPTRIASLMRQPGDATDKIRRLGREFGEALADLHTSLDWTAAPTDLEDDIKRARDTIRQAFNDVQTQLFAQPETPQRARQLHQLEGRRDQALRRVEQLGNRLERNPPPGVSIHGDTNPTNIIVRPDGSIGFIDFEFFGSGASGEGMGIGVASADFGVAREGLEQMLRFELLGSAPRAGARDLIAREVLDPFMAEALAAYRQRAAQAGAQELAQSLEDSLALHQIVSTTWLKTRERRLRGQGTETPVEHFNRLLTYLPAENRPSEAQRLFDLSSRIMEGTGPQRFTFDAPPTVSVFPARRPGLFRRTFDRREQIAYREYEELRRLYDEGRYDAALQMAVQLRDDLAGTRAADAITDETIDILIALERRAQAQAELRDAEHLAVARDEPVPELLQEAGEDSLFVRDAAAQDSELILFIAEERQALET